MKEKAFKLNDLHAKILSIIESNSISLVDNRDFIQWAMSHDNPQATREPWMADKPTELDDFTKSYWLSGYEGEAAPIVTVQNVRNAMTSMFWFRVNNDLEWAAIESMMMLPDIESCSKETREVGYEIGNAYYDGTGVSLELMNQEQFLTRVIDWLEKRYN